MNASRYQNDRGVRTEALDLSKVTADFDKLRDSVHGGFRVILADPPWPFANHSPAGMKKNAAMHYPCMQIEDLCALPVHRLAGENCALFLWCCWPFMPQWARVIDAWGFLYAGLAWEWIKFNPETGKYAFGPGYGTRKNLEPCLLATKGNPKLRQDCPLLNDYRGSAARSVRDFILEEEEIVGAAMRPLLVAPRREHSRKPDEARRRIETMFEGPYVELFARSGAAGWQSWGNETEKFSLGGASQ